MLQNQVDPTFKGCHDANFIVIGSPKVVKMTAQ